MLFLLQVTVPVGWVRVRYPSFCQALHKYLCLGDIWQLAYITETLRPFCKFSNALKLAIMFPWLLLLPFSLKKLVLPKLHKTFAVRLRRFFWDLSFHFHSIESVKKHVHVRLITVLTASAACKISVLEGSPADRNQPSLQKKGLIFLSTGWTTPSICFLC